MDLAGLIDMNYFWWAFNKLLAPAMPFLVIFIAVSLSGLLISTPATVLTRAPRPPAACRCAARGNAGAAADRRWSTR